MTVTVMAGDTVVETIACASEVVAQAGPRSVLDAPKVEFVSKWHLGRPPEQVARDGTGLDRATGELRLTVSMRNLNNRMVRFDCDLWRLPFDFHPDALALLEGYWDLLNLATPERVRARMERHFSRTFLQVDVIGEQANDCKDFLETVVAEAASYTCIDGHYEVRP